MGMFTDHLHDEIDSLLRENEWLREIIGVLFFKIERFSGVLCVSPWDDPAFKEKINSLGCYKNDKGGIEVIRG